MRSGTPGFPKALLNIEFATCKGLIEKIRAAFDKKGQKSTFFEKKSTKTFTNPYSVSLFYIKINFCIFFAKVGSIRLTET